MPQSHARASARRPLLPHDRDSRPSLHTILNTWYAQSTLRTRQNMADPDLASARLTVIHSHKHNEKCQATAAAHSPDGSLLAIAYSSFGSHQFANRVLVWDVSKWRKVKVFDGCT